MTHNKTFDSLYAVVPLSHSLPLCGRTWPRKKDSAPQAMTTCTVIAITMTTATVDDDDGKILAKRTNAVLWMQFAFCLGHWLSENVCAKQKSVWPQMKRKWYVIPDASTHCIPLANKHERLRARNRSGLHFVIKIVAPFGAFGAADFYVNMGDGIELNSNLFPGGFKFNRRSHCVHKFIQNDSQHQLILVRTNARERCEPQINWNYANGARCFPGAPDCWNDPIKRRWLQMS